MTDPPSKLRTVCPACRALLEVAAEFAGRPVVCGRCRQVFPAEVIQPNPPAPFPKREGGASGWPAPATTFSTDGVGSQPNPLSPFPKREGGKDALPSVMGDGSTGASTGLAPPSLLGKGAGGLGCGTPAPSEPDVFAGTHAPLAPPSLLGKGAGGLGFTPDPDRDTAAPRRASGISRRYDDDFDDRPRRPRRADGSATASLVLGIVSLVCFCVFPVSLTTGAIGAWLGVAGLKSRSRPTAVTGLTLSAVGIVFGLGFAVLFLAGIVKAVNETPRLGPTRNNPTFNAR